MFIKHSINVWHIVISLPVYTSEYAVYATVTKLVMKTINHRTSEIHKVNINVVVHESTVSWSVLLF